MKLNKLMALLLIPMSVVALASCDDGGEITNDSKLSEWVEKDIDTIARLDEELVLPYDASLFESYKIVTPASEEGEEDKISYDRNYSLEYDSDLAKLFLYYTTVEAKDAKTYADYCINEGWIADESIVTNLENDYYVYTSIVDTDKVSNRIYLNIRHDLGKMTVMGYKEVAFHYPTWSMERIETYLGLKAEDNLFPAPSEKVKDVTFNQYKTYNLKFLEITCHSDDPKELENYRKSLQDGGFIIDKYYETDTRDNYYLIPEGKNYALNVYLDKAMDGNSFTMRFDKDNGKR